MIVLSAVFLLSHAVGLLVYEHNRGKTVVLTEATDLADRIIGIVQLANAFPDRDREQILAAAETQFLTMFPEVLPFDASACRQDDYHARMTARFEAVFDDMPGHSAKACIRGLEEGGAVRGGPSADGFDVLITITFPDGQRSVFHALLPDESSIWQDGSLWYFLAVLVLTLVLAGYLILRVVAPLGRLARAAELIGIDIDSPPLPVEGPSEVEAAASALNDMHDRLQRQIHNQRDIMAAVSHDLRSSLTRLQLRADLLQDDEAREGLLRVIDDMRLMVQGVVDFVRGIDTHEAPRRLDLATLLESLCHDMVDEGYAVEWRETSQAPAIHGRPAALRRGFQNLILNAVKYGQCAEVSLDETGGMVEVVVRDHGPGIPEDQLRDVMTPFFRLERSRNVDTGGVGLGLPITQNVVNAHGGTLSLRNHAEGGLEATVCLPLFDRAGGIEGID